MKVLSTTEDKQDIHQLRKLGIETVGQHLDTPNNVRGDVGIFEKDATGEVIDVAFGDNDFYVEKGDYGLVDAAYASTEWGAVAVVRREPDFRKESHEVIAVFDEDYDVMGSEPSSTRSKVDYSVGIGRGRQQFDPDIHDDPEELVREAEEYAADEMSAYTEIWREKGLTERILG